MPERRRHPSHDAAWKQFFALSVVVEHLLGGFFREVAALLDFATLRDISGEWVQDGTRRRSDSVWRVRYRDGTDRSLVVLLEFQSTVDASMARRVLRNVGMAYERLRRNGGLDRDGRLRPLRVYPRAGGGTSAARPPPRILQGLSPRRRGNPERVEEEAAALGSIPAQAGEPNGGIRSTSPARVYPRAGGGNLIVRFIHGQSHGSIPAQAGGPL